MPLRHLASTLALLAIATAPGRATLPAHVPGEILVRWRPAAKVATLEQAWSLHRVTTVGRTGAVLYRIEGDVEDAVNRLGGSDAVAYAEPNYLWSIDAVPNDPSFDEQWSLENVGQTGGRPGADISAVAAWSTTIGSRAVVVAVIDTGVDLEHPDLIDNLWVNPGEIADNGIDDDGNGFVDDVQGWDFLQDDALPFDENEHGTHVAGTIGAVGNNGFGVTGVAWRVSLLPLRFLDADGRGDTVDGARCVEYATLMGVDVINASWGGAAFSQTLLSAIEQAHAAGIVFVAAAGNEGVDTDTHPHYPSSYDLPNIVAVASTGARDELSGFSNYGATSVDLAAPGESILSTVPGRTYGHLTGTSMATPHVAGTFALLRAVLPQIPYDVAIAQVLDHVDPLDDLTGLMRTGGRLNAHAAIADPDSLSPDPVLDLTVTGAGSQWLELAWTATGDDHGLGSASWYEVRYAEFDLNEVSWPFAAEAEGVPTPADAGRPETFRLEGLEFHTSYSLALMAFDDFGNPSGISNVVRNSTLGAPSIATTPDALEETLHTGAARERTVLLSNVGEGTLDFEAVGIEYDTPVTRATPPGAPPPQYRQAYASTKRPAGEPRRGPRAWTASALERVATPASDILFFDDFETPDTGWMPFSIGGDGEDHWRRSIARRFSGATSWNGFPAAFGGSDALVSPPIDLASARAATLSFRHWYDFDDCDDPTFEADGGVVEISVDDGLTWQRLDPISGYPYVLDAVCGNPLAPGGAYAHRDATDDTFLPASFDLTDFTGRVVRLRFHAGWDCGNCRAREGWYVDDVLVARGTPPWLSVSPEAGTVWAGQPLDLSLGLDATGLFGGQYEARILLTSNDPVTELLRVPVSLQVTGAPDLYLAEASLDFGTVLLTTSASRVATLYNLGDVPLSVTSVGTDDAHFVVVADPFVLEAFAIRPLEVAFTPTAEGAATAHLTLTSDDPDLPLASVSLSADAVPPPHLVSTPAQFEVTLAVGESTSRTLTLRNEGASPLSLRWTLQPAPALSASITPATPSRDAAPGAASSAPDAHPVPARLRERTIRPAVLVVQNTRAWGLDLGDACEDVLGLVPDVIDAGQLAAVALDDYDLVITASDEDDAFYAALSAAAPRLEDYVRRGGVLQAQVATHGADVVLPGGVVARWGAAEIFNRVVDREHPVTAGLPVSLEGDFANHGHLTDLPPQTLILTETQDSRQPTTVEYALDRGRVLATSMTWELLFARSFPARAVLPQAMRYCFGQMRVGGLPWLFAGAGQARLGPQETMDVTLDFDGLEGEAVRHALLILSSNDPARLQTRIPIALTVTGGRGTPTPATAPLEVPAVLELAPLRPNPSAGATQLRFAVPADGPVRLEVFDVRGRRVRTLVDGPLSAGWHDARWSGVDTFGQAVAAGVYFVRLEQGRWVATARLVIGR